MDVQPTPLQYLAIGAAACLLLGLRFWRLRRPRRLRLETLWAQPAVLAVVLVVALYEFPPATLLRWLWPALALALGAVPGWYRGKLMRISVDPATHRLNHQGSPAAMLFLLLILVARQAFRYEAVAWHLDLMDVGSWLIAFAVGFYGATRAEMWLRARRLLAAHRAAG